MNYKTLMHISLYFFFRRLSVQMSNVPPTFNIVRKNFTKVISFFSFVGVYSWKEEADIKEAQTVQFNK